MRSGRGLGWKTGTLLWGAVLSVCAGAQVGSVTRTTPEPPSSPRNYFLYVGTFTTSTPNGHADAQAPSKGIYVARFDGATGDVGEPVLAAEAVNPSVLVASPDHRFLYAISEISPEAFVTAYSIDAQSGDLEMLDKVPTGGAGTTYISVDKTGKYVLLANYGSGSISVVRVEADGSLGRLTSWVQHSLPRGARNAAGGSAATAVPHPHSTVVSPDNRFVIVPDFGLNQIFVYSFDAGDGTLRLPAAIVPLPAEEGPRHFVFAPGGKFAYLINQNTGNVITFSWDAAQGKLAQLDSVSSFPPGLDATNMSGEIGLTPDGKFLYESNRRTHGGEHELGPDSIGVFRVDAESGKLTEIQDVAVGGAIPRCFSIDPSGNFLALGAQQENRVEIYRIDQESGRLTNTGKSISIHTPACMQFEPAR